MTKNKFSVLVIVLFFFVATVFAEETKESMLENENIAKQLSKEWDGNSINRSISIFEKTADFWLKNKEPNKATDNLRQIAKLQILLNEPHKALDSLQKTTVTDKQNSYTFGLIETLAQEILINLNLGNIVESERLMFQLNEISTQSNDKNNQISINYTSAMFFLIKHQNQKSIEYFQKALQIAQEIDSNSMQGEINLKLSYLYMMSSEFEKSKENGELSLQFFQKSRDVRGIALAYLGLGTREWHVSNKQKSFEYLVNAQKLFPADVDFYEKAKLFNVLATLYDEYESNEVSYENRKQALELFRKAKHINGQIQALLSISNTSKQLNDSLLAIKYLEEAEQLATKVGDKFFLAIIESEKAHNYFFLKNYFVAEQLFKNALKNLDKEIYKLDVGLISIKLGEIHLARNNFAEARKSFEFANQLFSKTKDFVQLSETNYQIAKLDYLESKFEDSLQRIKTSLNLTESLYSDVANSNLQRSYFSSVYDRYELYIYLLMQKYKTSGNQEFLIQALQATEKSRSRSMLETLRLSEANFTKDANPELVAKEKDLRNLLNIKTTKLVDLLNGDAETTEVEKVENEIRALDNELETVKSELKQNSPVYSEVKNPAPFEVAEFQKNILDDNTVLLAFSLGERESYLWLVTKNEVSHVILPMRDVIENRIETIRQNFESRQALPNEEIEVYQKRTANLEPEFAREAQLLSNDLLGQVVDKIQDKRLIIVPDGKLSLLPISALPVPNSDEPLILRHEIVYEPSASLLNILAKLQTAKQLPTKDLLVFADPVFNQTDNRLVAKISDKSITPTILGLNLRDFRVTDSTGNISRLFATQDEADSIVKIVGQSQSVLATGFSANRDRILKSNLADYRILHFATHGLVDVKRPEISSILLSQFDENGNKQEGDLRMQDIYSLNLAADLVVLSACRSGIGKEVKGEGLMSLNNAFLQAGAKSVLSSAWKVDDYATAELMKYFYENLTEKNLTPPNALRQAQLKMLSSTQFKSPFDWAAFTVHGDFRQPISITKTNYYYYLIPILVLVGLLTFWLFRKAKT